MSNYPSEFFKLNVSFTVQNALYIVSARTSIDARARV